MNRFHQWLKWPVLLCLSLMALPASSQDAQPKGEISGRAWSHSDDSLKAVVAQADVCLPSAVTGGEMFLGKFKDAAASSGRKVPVILFLHGSSGLGLKAIGEWQKWLCGMGYASVAPDSFALNERVTYKSPIDKISYERIHALRRSEIKATLDALKAVSWADPDHLVLAGMSEGAVAVARYPGADFAAKIIYSWSCEDNYFVEGPQNNFDPAKPVLNVISSVDPFFSKVNSWLDSPTAQGHCGKALASNARASVLLIPDAPHTLINLQGARNATAGFLSSL